MNDSVKQSKTDEEIWEELLNSKEGQAALEALLKEAEDDIENDNITEGLPSS